MRGIFRMTAATISSSTGPTVTAQIERLVDLGVPALAGITPAELRKLGTSLQSPHTDSVVVVHPALVSAALLASLLNRDGKPGFVVEDMNDLTEFVPIEGVLIPESPLYLIHRVERGDDMSNWSPDEALPEIRRRGRQPLTVSEGVSWLLQRPDQLEPNWCFMTIASRMKKGKTLDSRTPAIWISGGTGRDGRTNRGAPKVGWCWAGNRHTWLGFASADGRG